MNELLKTGRVEPPTPNNTFWKTAVRFQDSKGIGIFALRKVDITNVIAYNRDGMPLTIGAAENMTLWLNAHPESFKLLLKNLYTKINFSRITDLTYAKYAELLQPEEVLETLNQYFDRIIDVVFEYEGTLDKFIGDCVMAIFGAPLDQPDHFLRACKCAVKIRDEIKKLNQTRQKKNKPILYSGIAVNTGEVVAGNIGSEKRTDYSVVGDTVNVAFRLQQIAHPEQILIGENVYQYVKNEVVTSQPFETEIKGKTKPVKVYELLRTR